MYLYRYVSMFNHGFCRHHYNHVPWHRTCTYLVLIYIYTIFKAPVSTVVVRHIFTNNPLQLFQINPLHAYRWPNGGPARARHPRATTLAQTHHVGLLTVPGQPVGPLD
jgi:hypothetical protein